VRQRCGVVLDQFTTGSYGTFAVEAMAAGRPVVGLLSPQGREIVGGDTIVDATPARLRGVLEDLLADRAGTARLGTRSAEFARTYHDGRLTARVLSDFLGVPVERLEEEADRPGLLDRPAPST
jgi:glycosyltransferase involved in cell wall biosynthesis